MSNDPWYSDRTHPLWACAVVIAKGIVGTSILAICLWWKDGFSNGDLLTLVLPVIGWLVTETAFKRIGA